MRTLTIFLPILFIFLGTRSVASAQSISQITECRDKKCENLGRLALDQTHEVVAIGGVAWEFLPRSKSLAALPFEGIASDGSFAGFLGHCGMSASDIEKADIFILRRSDKDDWMKSESNELSSLRVEIAHRGLIFSDSSPVGHITLTSRTQPTSAVPIILDPVAGPISLLLSAAVKIFAPVTTSTRSTGYVADTCYYRYLPQYR